MLRGVTFTVPKGVIYGFLGPNGAGKTTTLKVITGLLFHDAGEVAVLGETIGDRSIRSRVGFLPETPYFYDYLSGQELLVFMGRLLGVPSPKLWSRIQALVRAVGLEGKERLQLRKYSKGMLQRVGLAQALVNDPEIVFLDEPMSGLDPVGRREIRDIILSLKGARQDGLLLLPHPRRCGDDLRPRRDPGQWPRGARGSRREPVGLRGPVLGRDDPRRTGNGSAPGVLGPGPAGNPATLARGAEEVLQELLDRARSHGAEHTRRGAPQDFPGGPLSLSNPRGGARWRLADPTCPSRSRPLPPTLSRKRRAAGSSTSCSPSRYACWCSRPWGLWPSEASAAWCSTWAWLPFPYFSAMTAIFVGIGLIYREIEHKTIYNILPNPCLVAPSSGSVRGASSAVLLVNLAAMIAALSIVLVFSAGSRLGFRCGGLHLFGAAHHHRRGPVLLLDHLPRGERPLHGGLLPHRPRAPPCPTSWRPPSIPCGPGAWSSPCITSFRTWNLLSINNLVVHDIPEAPGFTIRALAYTVLTVCILLLASAMRFKRRDLV